MIDDYRKARKIGKKQLAAAETQGMATQLPALDDLLGQAAPARERSIGLCEVPLERIVGTRTKGRQNLFSPGFMPLAEEGSEFAAKWSRLYDAQLGEGFRDPIVAVEFLQRFYVQEGNKRVSVARYVGMPTIAAQLTRVAPPQGAGFDGDLAAYEEFERFYAVAPTYDFELRHVGDYEQLARLLGRDLVVPWPEDAVRRLTSSFYLFRSALAHRGMDSLSCSASEAFLLYLEAYADKDPLDVTPRLMDERVAGLKGELRVASKSDPIAFVGDPDGLAGGVVSKIASKVLPSKERRVAFVYDRSPATSGWVALHDRARGDGTGTQRGWESVAFENCATDEELERAVCEAETLGCSRIVTTSPRQMAQALRSAIAHPNLSFLNCSISLPRGSVRTYYARMYEVKFLMGALAAAHSQTHQLGYLAFSPINGAVAEVNAFALGAALADPHATVHLRWLSAAAHWQDELVDLGVDVVADRDYPDPTAPDEPWGLYALHDGAISSIGVPVWDWARYYDLLFSRDAADNPKAAQRRAGGRAINYWWGMKSDVVRFELAEGVALGQRRLAEILGRVLCEGWLDPFDTLLLNQQGDVVRAEDEPPLSDAQIAQMNWLNINVAGSLPKRDELSAGGRADVEAAGVLPEA